MSVGAAIFLTGFKFFIGYSTNSLGILSEAFHSFFDLIATVVTLYAVKLSCRDADKDHHYGHGKVENFSALFETLLLFGTCIYIFYESIQRFITGKVEIEVTVFSYLVVLTSISIDFWRSRKLMKAAKKFNSQALEADALHFSTDIWSSGVVLFGLICVTIGKYTGFKFLNYADAVAAMIVSMIIIFVSYRMGKKSIDALLDKAPDGVTDEIEIIVKTFETFKRIKHYHDFKVRQSGEIYFVEFCIHVPNHLPICEAHEISDEMEKEIKKIHPTSKINIHIEPENHKH